MATLRRVRVVWSGLTGLPGISTFYTGSAVDAIADLNTFFTALTALFPPPLTWNIPNSGDTIDDATGTLNGGWTSSTAYQVVASSAATSYAAGTGAFVRWGTASIVGGRRLRGRTFLAPVASAYYDAAGTMSATFLTTAGPAVSTLLGTGKLVIWHRPPPGGSSGSSSLATSGFIPDQVTSLRSRRF